jgi:hypothetical protein
LIEKGIDVNFIKKTSIDEQHSTLYYAVIYNGIDIIKALIEKGAKLTVILPSDTEIMILLSRPSSTTLVGIPSSNPVVVLNSVHDGLFCMLYVSVFPLKPLTFGRNL